MGGVSPLQPTRGSGERRELPQRGPGRSPGVRDGAPVENGFWRFLKATERSFLYLYDKICGGQFAVSSPTPNSGGRVAPAPRDLRPCTHPISKEPVRSVCLFIQCAHFSMFNYILPSCLYCIALCIKIVILYVRIK